MQSKRYIDELILLHDRVSDWDAYPYSVPSVKKLKSLRFPGPVTCLLGDNGAGKTTILESIAVLSGLNLEGGSLRHDFSSTGRVSQLSESIRLSRSGGKTLSKSNAFFYRAEHFAHFVKTAGFLQHPILGCADLTKLSRGEAFHALVKFCFAKPGLYLLDEPEVALPPAQQLAFLRIMYDLVQLGSQFIVVSHSPIILAYPEAVLYELSEDGIKKTDYESTEHYRTMHSFMLNRKSVLHELLRD